MENERKVYEIPEFDGGNIPEIMKKDQLFIRQGMIKGILPIGSVFKLEGSQQYNYYISPKLFWEFTGYVYREDK